MWQSHLAKAGQGLVATCFGDCVGDELEQVAALLAAGFRNREHRIASSRRRDWRQHFEFRRSACAESPVGESLVLRRYWLAQRPRSMQRPKAPRGDSRCFGSDRRSANAVSAHRDPRRFPHALTGRHLILSSRCTRTSEVRKPVAYSVVSIILILSDVTAANN